MKITKLRKLEKKFKIFINIKLLIIKYRKKFLRKNKYSKIVKTHENHTIKKIVKIY